VSARPGVTAAYKAIKPHRKRIPKSIRNVGILIFHNSPFSKQLKVPVLPTPEKIEGQDGCTGVIVMETGKPNMHVDPTPEEIEHVRAELEQRRATRGKPTDIG